MIRATIFINKSEAIIINTKIMAAIIRATMVNSKAIFQFSTLLDKRVIAMTTSGTCVRMEGKSRRTILRQVVMGAMGVKDEC